MGLPGCILCTGEGGRPVCAHLPQAWEGRVPAHPLSGQRGPAGGITRAGTPDPRAPDPGSRLGVRALSPRQRVCLQSSCVS